VIRRNVNSYWKMELDGLSGSLVLRKSEYDTTVSVVVSADGHLKSVRITEASGTAAVDACVVAAFRAADPFAVPPPILVHDGAVVLPDFVFTVMVGGPRHRKGEAAR
jgi:TonB family protein